jgi:tRNA U38,U39,U40 pseudouridine synthase TruA
MFFNARNWSRVESFWTTTVRIEPGQRLPSFVEGDQEYGIADLKALHEAGMRGEFLSLDNRYRKRQTFAVRLGYVGSCYSGFQTQKGANGVHTVEDDIRVALRGHGTYGAGRTDSGVSAVSQVIGFFTTNMEKSGDDIIAMMQASEPVKSGRLSVYDCYRVPKKFNARSTATWRRYLYLFPLNEGKYEGGFDVDMSFINRMFQRIQGQELGFNGLATGEDRNVGEGSLDYCTLFRARAFVVDLASGTHTFDWQQQQEQQEQCIDGEMVSSATAAVAEGVASSAATASVASATPSSSSAGAGGAGADEAASPSSSSSPPYTSTGKAMCVELVGSRFLRQMVRVLVATATRESVLPDGERNVDLLMEICKSRDRTKTSVPLPGEALCFCGVGYDAHDMAIYKYMKKAAMEAVMAERTTDPTSSVTQRVGVDVSES